MSKHELTITRSSLLEHSPYFFGECECGWQLRRSRSRDLKRAFVKHITEVVKPVMEEHERNMQEPTP